MATIAAFDTLRAAKRLKELGFSDTQAEGFAEMFREQREADFSQLVTKDDLDRRFAELRTDLDRRFAESDYKLTNLEHRMTIKLGGLVVAAVGLVAAVMKMM